jgi:hypothetical protein
VFVREKNPTLGWPNQGIVAYKLYHKRTEAYKNSILVDTTVLGFHAYNLKRFHICRL